MKGRKVLQLLLAATASVIVGYFVVSRLSLADLEKLLRDFDFRLLAVAFVVYLAANVLRALRFRLLVGGEISTLAFLRIIFIQNFMNTFLPFRAGEFSYLYMVHRAGSVTPGHNLGSLLGARAMDLFVALLIPLAMSPLSQAWSAPGHPVAWLALFVIGVAATLAIGIARARQIADYISIRIVSKRAFLVRMGALLGDTLRALGQLRESQLLARVVLLSLGCWLLIYASGYMLLAGTGLLLSVPDGLFAYGFPTIASMTPLYMLGGFGVYEGSVGAGLSVIGVPIGPALATGLLLHVAELLFIILPALASPLLSRTPTPVRST